MGRRRERRARSPQDIEEGKKWELISNGMLREMESQGMSTTMLSARAPMIILELTRPTYEFQWMRGELVDCYSNMIACIEF